MVNEDPTLHRQQRVGYYGWAELGFGVLDNRRIILGPLSIGDRLDYETLESMDAREYGDLQISLESQSMTLHDEGGGCVVAWMYDTRGHHIDPVVSPEQPDCKCE